MNDFQVVRDALEFYASEAIGDPTPNVHVARTALASLTEMENSRFVYAQAVAVDTQRAIVALLEEMWPIEPTDDIVADMVLSEAIVRIQTRAALASDEQERDV